MANAFEAYQLYLSLKSHFTNKKYDFFKFCGKVNCSVSSFESRSDKSFFYKISKKYGKAKLTDFYVANFINDPNIWIGNLLDESAEEIYSNWQKKIESLTYHFTQECHELFQWSTLKGIKFNELFQVQNYNYPILVRMAQQNIISLESFIIFNRILDFGKQVDKSLNDVVWEEFWNKVCKYDPFLHIDVIKCKQELRKIIKEYPSII
jgi:hypothetical protein